MGENYFVLEFKTENNKLTKWPHLSNKILDSEGIKFWLYDLDKIEQTELIFINNLINNIVIKSDQNYSDLVNVPSSYSMLLDTQELKPDTQKYLGIKLNY